MAAQRNGIVTGWEAIPGTVPVDVAAGTDLVVHAQLQRAEFRLAVDFAVAPGEILGVLGPNGAGKSTLLRLLAGLTQLSDGSIRLGGQLLDDAQAGVFVPPERRPVGLLFQNYRLFPHLSVRDNVAFAPRCQGLDRRAARAIADEWLQRFGLAGFGKRKPGELSGGQAQRVALARALAANPGLLLLDEPLSALDARTRLEVRGELRRHLADFDGPTLIVTHDPLEALVLADRLLVIEDGRIVQEGPPAEVARRPATQYIARLVGVNLYHGVRSGPEVTLDAGGTLVVVADADPPADRGRVLAAVRPNAVVLYTSRPEHASPRNVWSGRVAGMELLTDRIRIQVTGPPDVLIDVTPDAVAELALEEGQPVWVSVKATEIDVYPDPAS